VANFANRRLYGLAYPRRQALAPREGCGAPYVA
jgi:hypothetical protein